MQIFNVRFGLATNSSSSHSLIFLKEGLRVFDYSGERQNFSFDPDQIPEYTPVEQGSFGWQFFTAASKEIKLRYLGILLRDRLRNILPENIVNLIIRDWCSSTVGGDDYIDHQSFYSLPLGYNSNVPDEKFFRQLVDYFLDERLVILGGNDNSDEDHPLDDGTTFQLPLPMDEGSRSDYLCRYDETYNFWTTFSPTSGAKVRFRLRKDDPDNMFITPEKASAPELVDVKLTDYCPFQCKYCYQSSTPHGEHGDPYALDHILEGLSKLKVFEVAFGGGEPTFYPGFIRILGECRRLGIVPNFTTKNTAWLRDPTQWRPIIEKCGAFAFSASNRTEIHDLLSIVDYNGINHSKVNIHIVMGTIDAYNFKQMIQECHDNRISVTLLGYKNVGFGKDYESNKQKYSWWLKAIQGFEHLNCNISIDTSMASEYEDEIKEAGVSPYLFHTKEGKFSCYIDVVKKLIGPSSFCDESELLPLKYGYDPERDEFVSAAKAIQTAFATF